MRLSVCQSNFLPWRGYFDLIRCADVFVFHDDIQYTKQDWRNRNRLKMNDGTHWFTVPVKKHPTDTAIDHIEIDGHSWVNQHRGMIASSLSLCPHYRDVLPLIKDLEKFTHLSAMNQELIRRICFYLGIHTQRMDARPMGLTGKKTEKILAICKYLGADTYISGPAARQYLDVDLLENHGIKTEWKDYNYLSYPQPWGAFDGAVTILDLIANLGPEAQNNIYSMTEY